MVSILYKYHSSPEMDVTDEELAENVCQSFISIIVPHLGFVVCNKNRHWCQSFISIIVPRRVRGEKS